MKLYILQQNGIVKVGITKHENVTQRISQINSKLPKQNYFKLVCDFEVNSNASMIERLIHEYLGINQLNLQYLKNEMLLVDVDYLHSSQTGYTELFLADKDKIKQVITLFGILDYINVDLENFKKIDNINQYSFDYLAENYPQFLKACEPTEKNKNPINHTYIHKSVQESIHLLNNKEIKADFFIEGNRYYLTLDNNAIDIEELTQPQNLEYINKLLSHKNQIKSEKKEMNTLYSIIRKIREDNRKTSLQPLLSMQKELKEHEFFEFMKINEGYKKIKQIIEPWHSEGMFAYELLGFESEWYSRVKEVEMNWEGDRIPLELSQLEKLNDKSIMLPNFDSPVIFPGYLSLVEKDMLILSHQEDYNRLLQSVKIISSIYKIIYNSIDKEEEIKKIENFMDYVDDYDQYLSDPSHSLRCNKPIWELEKIISLFMEKNKNYIDLGEAVIRVVNSSEKTEKLSLSKLNNLCKK